MKNLTVRNLPVTLARALEKETRRAGQSLNRTVIRLLSQSLGLNNTAKRSNGLANLAGGWSEEEFQEFEKVVNEVCERIDPDAWR